jgi:hypothetical protein
MATNWVTQVAAEERHKEGARRSEISAAAHRAEAIRLHLLSLMVALRNQMTRDVETFHRELPNRHISFVETSRPDEFAVRRDWYPEAHLTVSAHPQDGTIQAQYLFASAEGLSTPKLIEVLPDGSRGFAVHLKDSERPSFAGVEQLSEYLLRPLFTGQSR